LGKLEAFGYHGSNNCNYIWANEKSFILIWMKLKTFTKIGNIWVKSINLQQLHLIVTKFKQSYLKLGYIK